MDKRIWSVELSPPVRWAALAVLAVALLAIGELDGQQRAGKAHADYVAAQASRTVAIGRAQSQVVVRTEIQYRDRIKTVYVKGEVIEKQVPVYVTERDDAVYGVNVGFVRSYNAAWSGDAAGPAAGTDREPAGIPLSEVAATDAHNATACLAWREQALGWRQFYDDLKAATEAK